MHSVHKVKRHGGAGKECVGAIGVPLRKNFGDQRIQPHASSVAGTLTLHNNMLNLT